MSEVKVIEELFVGPAVVIDDKIDDPSNAMAPIVDQIVLQGIPILRLETLPVKEQIKHWRGMSLIVLDWDLFPNTPGAGNLPSGVNLPGDMQGSNDKEVTGFVDALIDDLYCPIFIFSNEDVGAIRSALRALSKHDETMIDARVMVRGKGALSDHLFQELTNWIRSKPSIYALKSWDFGYERAKKEMFADFHASSPMWPKILWETSGDDSVNPHSELTETITRNLLHRFQPLTFDSEIFETTETDPKTSQRAIRRVIHRQAVIGREAIHDDVLMPGDFFYGHSSEGLPDYILINIAPACDLVPRNVDDIDSVPLTILRADILRPSKPSSMKKLEEEQKLDSGWSQVLTVLTESAVPYRINFKSWRQQNWGSLKEHRQGRLLEPYITQLQQKFALYFHRQGFPRLPDAYKHVPGEAVE